jgi:hypothetical protein
MRHGSDPEEPAFDLRRWIPVFEEDPTEQDRMTI